MSYLRSNMPGAYLNAQSAAKAGNQKYPGIQQIIDQYMHQKTLDACLRRHDEPVPDSSALPTE